MKDNAVPDAPLAGLNGVAPPTPEWFATAVNLPFESGSVTVEGAAIEYRAWGERGRPGLLLLHGSAAHLGWWSFLAPMFAQDYRVVLPSFSGMGGSDWRPGGYSSAQYLREGFAAGEAAGVALAGPPVLVGHSMGGLPVVRAAAHHPEKMRAGVMVDSAFPGPEMTRSPPTGKPTHPIYPDLPKALSRFRLSPVQPCENLYIADYIARMSLKPLDGGRWTWRFDRSIWEIDHGNPWSDLGNAKVPLAILRGDLSSLTGGAMARRMRETAPPDTLFVDIPQAHHHVMIDQPLALVAVLRTLLALWH